MNSRTATEMRSDMQGSDRTASDIFGHLVAALNRPLGIIVAAAIIDRALHECEGCKSLSGIKVDRAVRYSYYVPPEVDTDVSLGDVTKLVRTVVSVVRQVAGGIAAGILINEPVIFELLER